MGNRPIDNLVNIKSSLLIVTIHSLMGYNIVTNFTTLHE